MENRKNKNFDKMIEYFVNNQVDDADISISKDTILSFIDGKSTEQEKKEIENAYIKSLKFREELTQIISMKKELDSLHESSDNLSEDLELPPSLLEMIDRECPPNQSLKKKDNIISITSKNLMVASSLIAAILIMTFILKKDDKYLIQPNIFSATYEFSQNSDIFKNEEPNTLGSSSSLVPTRIENKSLYSSAEKAALEGFVDLIFIDEDVNFNSYYALNDLYLLPQLNSEYSKTFKVINNNSEQIAVLILDSTIFLNSNFSELNLWFLSTPSIDTVQLYKVEVKKSDFIIKLPQLERPKMFAILTYKNNNSEFLYRFVNLKLSIINQP